MDKLPHVIDLFSGCGGLASGFKSAGFPCAGAVDSCQSSIRNFTANLVPEDYDPAKFIAADIVHVEPGLLRPKDKRCIVVGGPPCQAYSRVGRGKLKSLGPDRDHLSDARGRLFKTYLELCLSMDADIIVMENVSDSINYGGRNIPETVCGILSRSGYMAEWSLLNAANFGVPQIRERVILVAAKEGTMDQIPWPRPTHRRPDKKFTNLDQQIQRIASESRYFSMPQAPEPELPHWVTVKEAISDLPVLHENEASRYTFRNLEVELPYSTAPNSTYQKLMRAGTGSWNATTGHAYRRTPRDFQIFSKMKQGGNYLDACSIADKLFEAACRKLGPVNGNAKAIYSALEKDLVPPYARDKFHDKWKRLSDHLPSHTLVAHLGTDTYSHIHPNEPRGISVREAARLQSFPDDFMFWGSMSDAFRQIGNAVPPLLAKAIADRIAETLTTGKHEAA